MNAIVLIAVVLMIAGTAWSVMRRILSMSQQARRTEHVREVVDAVAREVQAGARPVVAAEHSVDYVEDAVLKRRLEVLVRRVRLGDKPGQLRVKDEFINHFLHLWHVSERHGIALGTLASLYVQDLDAHRGRQNTTSSALAGARVTMIVLLSMPIGALLLGESMGLGAAGFLVGSPLGSALLLVGTVLACSGVLWAEALTVTVLGGVGGRAGPADGEDPLDVARQFDVFAAALDAGLPTADAWGIASVRAQENVRRVTALLALGAGENAWMTLAKQRMYGSVARQAAQQTRSGTTLAAGVRAQAGRLRQQARNRATEGAEKVLVAMAAPLTLCFLPAFVLIGLVPLVIGLAGM
ncbi:type II secretion system F family protein [Corynebacterium urogenitale]